MKKLLLFFPHNFLTNSAGCHTRCWSMIDFFKKLDFEIYLVSFTDFDIYHWTEADINLSKEYFSDSLILSKEDAKNKFLKFAKKHNITHTLISYSYYSWLIEDPYFDSKVKICDTHDIIEYSIYMSDKLNSMFGDLAMVKSKDISNDLFKYDFISNKEIDSIKINTEDLKRFDLILSISDFEAIKLKDLGFKNVVYFTYSQLGKITKKNEYSIDPIFVASINPFNLQSYIIMRDRLKLPFKVNVIGNISNKIDRNNDFNIFGRVNDLSFFYKKTKFSLCPIIAGTGTKIKILDSMANGVPVVGTNFSAKGTPIIDNRNGFISNSWDDFVEKSKELYDNIDLQKKFSKNSLIDMKEYVSFKKNYNTIKNYL